MQTTDPIIDWGTFAIAVWGAIAGSVALTIELRRFHKDRASVAVEPSFQYQSNTLPPTAHLLVKIVNSGQRPTTIAAIAIQMRIASFRAFLNALRLRRPLLIVRNHLNKELAESRAETYTLSQGDLPRGASLVAVRRVIAIDQLGRRWRSAVHFGQTTARRYRAATVRDTYAAQSPTRTARVTIAQSGRTGLVLVEEVKEKSVRTQFHDLSRYALAAATYTRFHDRADQYVSGTLRTMFDE